MIYLITSGHHQLMRLLQSETDNVFMKLCKLGYYNKDAQMSICTKETTEFNVDSLVQGLGCADLVPSHEGRISTGAWEQLCQMPFLLPPVNHVGTSGS